MPILSTLCVEENSNDDFITKVRGTFCICIMCLQRETRTNRPELIKLQLQEDLCRFVTYKYFVREDSNIHKDIFLWMSRALSCHLRNTCPLFPRKAKLCPVSLINVNPRLFRRCFTFPNIDLTTFFFVKEFDHGKNTVWYKQIGTTRL